MTTETFKLTIHMVSSLDGMIAKKDNSVSWFDTKDQYDKGTELSKEDTEKFLSAIDCYVMGSRTYEHALALSKSYGWAYGDTHTIVLSQRKLLVERSTVELYAGDINKLINEKLKPTYKNVWLVGGPTLAKEFIRLQLADEIRLSILPVILGDGISFFNHIAQEQALHLNNVTAYKNGVVELRYEIKK